MVSGVMYAGIYVLMNIKVIDSGFRLWGIEKMRSRDVKTGNEKCMRRCL